MKHVVRQIPSWLLLLLMVSGALATEGQWSIFGYVSYSNGNYYLTEPTRNFYIAGGFRYRTLKWNASLSVPLVIQNSNLVQQTGNVFFPMGPEADTDGASGWPNNMGMGNWGRHRNFQPPSSQYISGLGDAYGYATYQLIGGDFKTYTLNVNGQIKIPTANRTFGTGEWDFGGSLAFQKLFTGTFSMGAELGYLVIGDPDSIQFQNPVFGSFSANWVLGPHFSVSAYYLWYSTIQAGIEPPRYLNLGFYYLITDKVALSGTIGRGFTKSSAAFTSFVSLEVTL